MKIIVICNRLIEYSFYLLFLLVPLLFTPWNFELFEFNKMTFIYLLTTIVVTAFMVKIAKQKELKFRKTPLDISIFLFLVVVIISSAFSIDVHTSIWGYYSRSNGGLISIISYIFLYYVFVNVMDKRLAFRVLLISLLSGLLVILWGMPSHFGHDPTCLLLQGSFDTSCWTEQFKPELRIFSTFGQPNWLAVYLSVLIPIAIAFGLNSFKPPANSPKKNYVSRIMYYVRNKSVLLTTCYLILTTLFYLALLFTKSRSGFAGLGIGLLAFVIGYFWLNLETLRKITFKTFIKTHRYLLVVLATLNVVTFIVGTPFEQLNKFTLQGLTTLKQVGPATINDSVSPADGAKQVGPVLETGGTESGEIRKIVWRGAIDVARHYPLFGSGVETFAYSYYKFRPAAHNLTSEWDYLYNKAHNEYLNYLATTGFVGLGAYLLMIGAFLVACIKYYVLSIKKTHNTNYILLTTALLAGYLSILVSNFFGFSVVITNLYLFLIPAFVFVLNEDLSQQKFLTLSLKKPKFSSRIITTVALWAVIPTVLLACAISLFTIIRFWVADTQYAQGYNLDRASQFAKAYQPLVFASSLRGDEPVFFDELAINNAMLATFFGTNDSTTSGVLVKNAIALSDNVTSNHPNIVTFWKTRARLFYSLSDIDEKYLKDAIGAIEKAHRLAPTDAKISYNMAVLYGQNNQIDRAIKTLEDTVRLKPDYRDAYYALGLFYDENGDRKRAIEQMEFILTKIASDDAQAKEKLDEWK